LPATLVTGLCCWDILFLRSSPVLHTQETVRLWTQFTCVGWGGCVPSKRLLRSVSPVMRLLCSAVIPTVGRLPLICRCEFIASVIESAGGGAGCSWNLVHLVADCTVALLATVLSGTPCRLVVLPHKLGDQPLHLLLLEVWVGEWYWKHVVQVNQPSAAACCIWRWVLLALQTYPGCNWPSAPASHFDGFSAVRDGCCH
jgi:hypothetical protein